MSLISYLELAELVESGVIDAPFEHINGSSIDVTLGGTLFIECPIGGTVDLAAKKAPRMTRVEIGDGYRLMPGQFVLAATREVFRLPNNVSCEFKLKSSGARSGLDNALATWCDPGWNGSVLTLELRNSLQHHALMLRSGMKIGQMVFYRCEEVPDHASYAIVGQYNGDKTATQSKGIR